MLRKFRDFKLIHPLNIYDIFSAKSVFNEDISKEVIEKQL